MEVVKDCSPLMLDEDDTMLFVEDIDQKDLFCESIRGSEDGRGLLFKERYVGFGVCGGMIGALEMAIDFDFACECSDEGDSGYQKWSISRLMGFGYDINRE